MEERCLHDLVAGQCADCKAPPAGLKKVGYRTKGGSAFHNDRDCPGLQEGQNFARYKGMDVHEPERIAWSAAQAAGLDACQVCGTEQWLDRQNRLSKPVGHKPCDVHVDGKWLPGSMKWLGRRDDGLWWAEVAYSRNGRRVVETKNQRDLRPRHTERA
ncbi:hypothetical protein [Allokutzneria sp. NRRL B-24872]|uniref:hypothetical protein n=1 Tax=Allokutzneria sp. NRRL B-24872 TaxID=1137961 RepID=UPI001177CA4C|nr:hypothetical protein [Allokutzneria sp. NRRL B-24872]